METENKHDEKDYNDDRDYRNYDMMNNVMMISTATKMKLTNFKQARR